jgi:predicted amidohydrolase YtcJ
VNHLDDTGRLRPGYRADLVVLDRDPFLHDGARVALTYVDGERVYAADN